MEGQRPQVQFSSVVSDSLQPHGVQHAKLPCPSSIPGAYSTSCPDQEGRRGSEEVVPGNIVGRIKGAKYRFDLQYLTWDFS